MPTSSLLLLAEAAGDSTLLLADGPAVIAAPDADTDVAEPHSSSPMLALILLAEAAGDTSSQLSSTLLAKAPAVTAAAAAAAAADAAAAEPHSSSLVSCPVALKERAVQICFSKHALDRRQNPRPRSLAFFMEHVNNTVLSQRCLHKIRLTRKDLRREAMRRRRNTKTPVVAHLPYHSLKDNYTKSSFMYFQKIKDGVKHGLNKYIPRKDKERSHLPHSEMSLIEEELIILPPVGGRMIYMKTNLHNTPHGGGLVSDLPDITTKLKQHGIRYTTIDSIAYSDTGIVDLMVEWGYVGLLNTCSAFRKIKNVSAMECKLVQFLIEQATLREDKARGKRTANGSVNARLSWGFIRAQPRSRESSRELNGKLIPSMSLHEFKHIPSECKDFLMMIAETSCKEAKRYHGTSALSHPVRNAFPKALHEKMGYPNTLAKFEYYDIVITSSHNHTQRHMDYLNDGRDNYNISCIYSFFNYFNGMEYKVSFIMTTRDAIGAALESNYKEHTLTFLSMLRSKDLMAESGSILAALIP